LIYFHIAAKRERKPGKKKRRRKVKNSRPLAKGEREKTGREEDRGGGSQEEARMKVTLQGAENQSLIEFGTRHLSLLLKLFIAFCSSFFGKIRPSSSTCRSSSSSSSSGGTLPLP